MNVLIGITGGIAAYKSCLLLREFQKAGHDVRVMMTQSAQAFVTPKTFEGLTNQSVYTEPWFESTKGNAHIELARWADCIIIAPATASILSTIATGGSRDFLSTTCLAFGKPLIFAPAMNTQMWESVEVQKNIASLKSNGHHILDPSSGELACREVGPGKMMEPEDIFRNTFVMLQKDSPLFGQNVLITAGPTREYLDPVRFLSSPATGTLGLLIAQVAQFRGANVTVIAGPMVTTEPFHGNIVPVVSAREMMEAVEAHGPCDVFVGTAAVADYCAQEIQTHKRKKTSQDWTPTLSRTPDILATVSEKQWAKKLTIGFCAQTQDLIASAREKLQNKKLDWIVANEVFQHQKGFGPGANSFSMLQKGMDEPLTFEDCPKEHFARVFWDLVEQSLPTA